MRKAFLSEILVKKWVKFSGLHMARTKGAAPPPFTVSLTVKYPFFGDFLKETADQMNKITFQCMARLVIRANGNSQCLCCLIRIRASVLFLFCSLILFLFEVLSLTKE